MSNCGSELRYFIYEMSSGTPSKMIKKFLTDTKQLKVSNVFSRKSVDAATAANPERPTITESSISVKALNGVFDDYDVTNMSYDGDCLFTCLAVGFATDSALQVRKEVIRQHLDIVRTKHLSYRILCFMFAIVTSQ
jgi:hypothetical protein